MYPSGTKFTVTCVCRTTSSPCNLEIVEKMSGNVVASGFSNNLTFSSSLTKECDMRRFYCRDASAPSIQSNDIWYKMSCTSSNIRTDDDSSEPKPEEKKSSSEMVAVFVSVGVVVLFVFFVSLFICVYRLRKRRPPTPRIQDATPTLPSLCDGVRIVQDEGQTRPYTAEVRVKIDQKLSYYIPI